MSKHAIVLLNIWCVSEKSPQTNCCGKSFYSNKKKRLFFSYDWFV